MRLYDRTARFELLRLLSFLPDDLEPGPEHETFEISETRDGDGPEGRAWDEAIEELYSDEAQPCPD